MEFGSEVARPGQSQPSVRTLEPASVVDQVTKEIRRAILAGSLEPGQEFSFVRSQLNWTSASSRYERRCASWRPKDSS